MRRIFLLIALFAAGLIALSPLYAQDSKEVPKPAAKGAPAAADATVAGAPSAPGAAKRTPEQIEADLQQAGGELRQVLTTPDVMLDPAQRKAAAPKAIPIIKRMVAGLDEVAQIQPDAKAQIADARMEFTTILSVFGDADATAELKKLASADGPQALDAKSAQQLIAFWTDPKDEAAQLKVLDEMQKLAKANPKSDMVGQTLMKMANMGAASKAVSENAENIITTDLTGEFAQQMTAQIKGQRKMRDSVGKPIELAGTQVDGTAFNTKDWKGKVIFVDFWATWCQPCLAELPRVKKAYLEHHAKGLEILGVPCDSDIEELKGFLTRNKDMPWPQLFDAKENPKLQWNPLAKEWGVGILPRMFLIDKKGILRSVEAGKDFEEQIPKLLAEKIE
jgi:thiol-disulfide isomerase/thioredoxin